MPVTKDELLQKRIWLQELTDNFYLHTSSPGPLHHYTSLPVLFNILEKDSFWVSGTRFSNDSSEEILLKNEVFEELNYTNDSFIMCFSDKADCLSQWRGYCPNGGVAIEFDVQQPRIYSILHADYDTSQYYETELNVPFPVLYVDQEHLSPSANSLSAQLKNDDTKYPPWNVGDIIPYFKNIAFEEEDEWRLLFGNRDGNLSQCVRFRTLQDGVKVPYMVVQAGDLAKNYSQCAFKPEEYSQKKLEEMRYKGINAVQIPQGNDQSSVYYKVEQEVASFNMKQGLRGKNRIRIFCEGHLPIRQIMVAPTYARERIAEKIKRYCWSNYWLRDVDVVYSRIPYIPPSE